MKASLRIGELLQERGMTAYSLAHASKGRLSLATAYRLAADKWTTISRKNLDVLCEILGCEPVDLFQAAKADVARSRQLARIGKRLDELEAEATELRAELARHPAKSPSKPESSTEAPRNNDGEDDAA